MIVRGVPKKTGLASEPITGVLEQVSKNGQVLLNPHNICFNLVYSSFFKLEYQRRYDVKRKKMFKEKVVYSPIFNVRNIASFRFKILCQNLTYRDILYTKSLEIL